MLSKRCVSIVCCSFLLRFFLFGKREIKPMSKLSFGLSMEWDDDGMGWSSTSIQSMLRRTIYHYFPLKYRILGGKRGSSARTQNKPAGRFPNHRNDEWLQFSIVLSNTEVGDTMRMSADRKNIKEQENGWMQERRIRLHCDISMAPVMQWRGVDDGGAITFELKEKTWWHASAQLST